MDLVTQGLLGAAVAAAGADRSGELRTAAGIGALAGVLPDADALIRSSSDPLLTLELHRHFSHSLLFIPVVAGLAVVLAWPFLRGRMPISRIGRYALLGAALAGVLDACTSYGTHLLWPFVDAPVALAIVAIVDPVISVSLILGLVLALRRGSRAPLKLALVACVVYLGIGAVQHGRAIAAAETLARERGHLPGSLLVKPTLGNLLLWRSLYVSQGRLYADAIRTGLGIPTVYPGDSAARLMPAPDRLDGELARFARLSGDLLVRHPTRPEMVGDARYAMLPTGLRPLWGVVPAPAGDPAAVVMVTDRSMSPAERTRFLDMLRGR